MEGGAVGEIGREVCEIAKKGKGATETNNKQLESEQLESEQLESEQLDSHLPFLVLAHPSSLFQGS